MPTDAHFLASLSLCPTNHRHLDNCPSTNTALIEDIKSGHLDAKALHLLTASSQSAGRGQRTRSWQSPVGNVYLSLYHPINTPVSGLLSLIVGQRLVEMPIIQTLNQQLLAQNLTSIQVKWANDLGYYQGKKSAKSEKNCQNEKRQSPSNDNAENILYFNKLAGILIEPVWQQGKMLGVVIGVGLNVKATPKLNQSNREGMSYHAISLADITELLAKNCKNNNEKNSKNIMNLPSLNELYQQISQALIYAVADFKQLIGEQGQNEQPNTKAFLKKFYHVDALLNKSVIINQDSAWGNSETSQTMSGKVVGIDGNGCLQLQRDDGTICAIFTGTIDVIG